MLRMIFGITVLALVAPLAFSGCEPGSAGGGGSGTAHDGSGEGNPNLAGSVSIEGSSTVEPVSNKAREEFNKKYPAVNISVGGQGTGNGFTALARKECDISDASRPIKRSEMDTCLQAGVSFVEIPVAWDGLTVVVNPSNDFVTQLDVEQLARIFRKDLAARTWKEVDPSWPDEKITVYAPGVASGTHDYFVEVIGKDQGLRDSSDGQTTLSEDDKTLVTGVKGEKYSIGFFGYSYFDANRNDLKAVPIVNPDGKAVMPSIESIESGEYAPLSRPLFIYVNMESYQRAEVREFVDYYLANLAHIATEARYVPLAAEITQRSRDFLDRGMAGTHFLDDNGEKRHGMLLDVYSEANLINK